MQTTELDALRAQCDELVALVDELSDADWERDTRCPGWSVKEMVAHIEGMLERLPAYNAQAVDGEPEIDRSGYYGYDPDGPREGEDPSKTFSEVIRDRALDEAKGRSIDDLKHGLKAAIDTAFAELANIPGDRVIKRSGHRRPIRYDEFVATRVLELGVHTMDVSHATLRGERVHPSAVPVITGILDGILRATLPKHLGWDDRTYILSGTGRRALLPNERYVLRDLADRFPLLR